jgi:predicted DNA-binding transcriptional regulator YafY
VASARQKGKPKAKAAERRPARRAAGDRQGRGPDAAGTDDDDDDDAYRPGPGARAREDRSKRLLDLVVILLGARTPVPYREIRAQFRAYQTENEEAGLRAFERDKADLLELGVPLRYIQPDEDDGVDEPGYVVDLRRYRLPEIHLTPDEIGALVLAGSVARAAPGTTYAEAVDLALKKLAFDVPPGADSPGAAEAPGSRRVPEPVLVHYPSPQGAAELAERLAELEQAIRNRKRVTFGYTSAQEGAATRRDVDPYGLVYRQGAWLLVGHCHLRKGVRTFRLDRVTELAVAPKPRSPDFERPEGFDVRAYASRSPWTFEIEAPVPVVLDVLPAAAAIADEDFGKSVKRAPLPGGKGTRVTFTCANPDFVVGRVLAAKGGLVVREPAALVARVRAELDALAARYGGARG